MATHHYETNDREAMALSLDSMYYHQNIPTHEPTNLNCLSHLQESSRSPHQQQLQLQQYQYYSAIRGQEDTQVADCNLQLPTIAAPDGLPDMKNWVSRTSSYPTDHEMQQKILGCMTDNGSEARSISAMAYGDLQSLSLSMSPGSQSSCITGSQQVSPAVNDCVAAVETKKRGQEKVDQKQIVYRKSIDTFGQRTSQYRGVTR